MITLLATEFLRLSSLQSKSETQVIMQEIFQKRTLKISTIGKKRSRHAEQWAFPTWITPVCLLYVCPLRFDCGMSSSLLAWEFHQELLSALPLVLLTNGVNKNRTLQEKVLLGVLQTFLKFIFLFSFVFLIKRLLYKLQQCDFFFHYYCLILGVLGVSHTLGFIPDLFLKGSDLESSSRHISLHMWQLWLSWSDKCSLIKCCFPKGSCQLNLEPCYTKGLIPQHLRSPIALHFCAPSSFLCNIILT